MASDRRSLTWPRPEGSSGALRGPQYPYYNVTALASRRSGKSSSWDTPPPPHQSHRARSSSSASSTRSASTRAASLPPFEFGAAAAALHGDSDGAALRDGEWKRQVEVELPSHHKGLSGHKHAAPGSLPESSPCDEALLSPRGRKRAKVEQSKHVEQQVWGDWVLSRATSITLRPLREAVAARNVDGCAYDWVAVDLCKLITTLPARFADLRVVILYDLDNAPGFFKFSRALPRGVMLCAFCGEVPDGLLKRVHQASSFIGDDRLFLTHCGSGKNSADLCLCFSAGELTSVLPESVHFIVVSNDQDFRPLIASLRLLRPRSYHSVPQNLDAAPDFHSLMSAATREIDQSNEVSLESGEALSLLFGEASSMSPYLKLRSSRSHLTPYRLIAPARVQLPESSSPRAPFVFGSPSTSTPLAAPRPPLVFGSSSSSSSPGAGSL